MEVVVQNPYRASVGIGDLTGRRGGLPRLAAIVRQRQAWGIPAQGSSVLAIAERKLHPPVRSRLWWQTRLEGDPSRAAVRRGQQHGWTAACVATPGREADPAVLWIRKGHPAYPRIGAAVACRGHGKCHRPPGLAAVVAAQQVPIGRGSRRWDKGERSCLRDKEWLGVGRADRRGWQPDRGGGPVLPTIGRLEETHVCVHPSGLGVQELEVPDHQRCWLPQVEPGRAGIIRARQKASPGTSVRVVTDDPRPAARRGEALDRHPRIRPGATPIAREEQWTRAGSVHAKLVAAATGHPAGVRAAEPQPRESQNVGVYRKFALEADGPVLPTVIGRQHKLTAGVEVWVPGFTTGGDAMLGVEELDRG